MKKFLASIIAVVLAVSGLSVISITANAATIFISGNYEYTVNSDDTVNIAGYKGIATDITIPSQILNKNVVKISDNSFYIFIRSIEFYFSTKFLSPENFWIS